MSRQDFDNGLILGLALGTSSEPSGNNDIGTSDITIEDKPVNIGTVTPRELCYRGLEYNGTEWVPIYYYTDMYVNPYLSYFSEEGSIHEHSMPQPLLSYAVV